MSLEIKSLSSPDVELGAEDVAASETVYFLLELEIGLMGEEPADLFQVVVATPEGLRNFATTYGKTPVVAERGTIVFADFSWGELHRALQRILVDCSDQDWQQSVLRLQRYFKWEYEDYILDESADDGADARDGSLIG